MKKKILSLLAAGFSVAVLAQTNSTLPSPPERDLELHSKHFYFDDKARQIAYYDTVRGTNEQGTLACERLTLYLPPEGFTNSMPTNVVAATNVIIDIVKKGDTNHIVCDKAIYNHIAGQSDTNYIITFTGNAKMQNRKGWMTGEPLIWDNKTQLFTSEGGETHVNMSAVSDKGTNDVHGTNSSPLDLLK